MWGPTNCLMAIFPEGPTWLKSWRTSSAHLHLRKSLNQTTNQFELRLHYTMSFAHKLTLMTFLVEIKKIIRGEIRTEKPRHMNPLAVPLDHQRPDQLFVRDDFISS